MLHLRPPFKGADVADDKSLQIYNLFWILTIYLVGSSEKRQDRNAVLPFDSDRFAD